MPRIISRYSERPSACQDQPEGHRIVSGHTPKMKIIPTTIKAMRRYLMRSASVMFVLLLRPLPARRCLPPRQAHNARIGAANAHKGIYTLGPYWRVSHSVAKRKIFE